MAATAIDNEVIELENAFWNAIRDGDKRKASEMVSDECLVTGGQGASKIDPQVFAKLMDDPKWELHEFRFDNVQVIHPSDSVAVIAYVVTEKLTVEGKPLTLEAADASTWVRRNGRWLCALHTESVLGDPFGRDRVKSN